MVGYIECFILLLLLKSSLTYLDFKNSELRIEGMPKDKEFFNIKREVLQHLNAVGEALEGNKVIRDSTLLVSEF